ncbi:MAG: IclR family transcriptional regulator [Actinomycetota bacterium]
MAGVQSIERAFLLLRALAAQPAGVTDLAAVVDLPKSTVARLLQALETEGAVDRDDDSVYRLGSAFVDLFSGNPRRNLIASARPYLIGLSAEIGEAAGLEVYENGWMQFVDQVMSNHDVQVREWTGESGRAHSLPTGIVTLAHLPTSEVESYLASPLEALTVNTMTDPELVRERMVQARSAGYLWCYEEFAMGINSVAAPVFGPDGPVAALQVHGPTYRFPDPNRTHDIGRIVVDAAQRLTEQLQGQSFLAT